MARDFVVPRFLRSRHLQTFGAAAPLFAPPRSHAAIATEEMRLPLAAVSGAEPHQLHARGWWVVDDRGGRLRRPLVLLVHGIGGSTASRYSVRAGVALHRAGYHVVRLDLRGAGASTPDVPTLYHAGLSADLVAVTEHLAKDPAVDGVVLFGFSGGGSMSLKLAGELGARVPDALRAVISVSAPLDYIAVSRWMDSLARLPYRFHVLRGLANGAREFARQHPERAHYRPHDVKRLSSFRTYDGQVIVPMHGFTDVDEYYGLSSPGPLLGGITIPTLLLHAEDDPMVPSHTIRPWLGKASSSVEVVFSPNGGHLGWVSGFDEASWVTSWSTQQALEFLSERLPPPTSSP